MGINNVRFVNFAVGDKNGGAQRQAAKEEVKQVEQQAAPQVAEKESKEFPASLDILGAQYKASINKVEPKELSPERVSDIEAMMAEFENGVNAVADTIDAEFPGFFAPDAKLALAAQIFATHQG